VSNLNAEILNAYIGESKFFKWSEALWLNSWGFHAVPNKDVARNILRVCSKLDQVRSYFGKPIIITSWWRPEPYNLEIGGAKRSAHMNGCAVDFIVQNMDSCHVRRVLKPLLESLNIRIESLPTPHIHMDIMDPGASGRYFNP